jgi:chromosomal replication initiation ATPase DnaA
VRSGWTDALERTKGRFLVLAIEVFERRRWRRTVEARQYFWMLLHDTYGWSFPEIARYMPTPYNHTTVLSGVRKARKREAESNAAPSGVHETVPHQEAFDDQTG